MNRQQVGVYVLAADQTFTKNDYETASWWKKIAVKAGEHPVYLTHWYGNRWTFVVEFSGIEVDQYFPSSYGGVPYTSGREPESNGKPEVYRITWDSYVMSRGLLENEPWIQPVTLNPEWTARWHHFEYDGEQCATTKMVNMSTGKEY